MIEFEELDKKLLLECEELEGRRVTESEKPEEAHTEEYDAVEFKYGKIVTELDQQIKVLKE